MLNGPSNSKEKRNDIHKSRFVSHASTAAAEAAAAAG